jgi:hypothetical protein
MDISGKYPLGGGVLFGHVSVICHMFITPFFSQGS